MDYTGHCPDCQEGITLIRDEKTASGANPLIQDYLLLGKCNNPHCPNTTLYGCICCLKCPSAYAKKRSTKPMGIVKVWGRIPHHCQLAGHKESVELWNAQKLSEDSHAPDCEEIPLPFGNDDVSDDDEDLSCPQPPTDTAAALPLQPSAVDNSDDENWILHLGRDVGQPVTSLDDITNTAVFDEKSNSPDFFWYEHQHPGMGARHLTAKAFQIRDVEDVTEEEARFTLIISSLLVQLTDPQKDLFAECLRYAVNYNDKEKSIFKKTRVPVTTEDFKRYYLKESSPTALIPNLPHPIPNKTSDGRTAFVSLFDSLANSLGRGTPMDKFHFEADFVFKADDEPSVAQTPAGYTLFMDLKQGEKDDDEFVLYIWIKRWRDDFDPNGTKQSRNQVWIHTFTCGAPPTENTGRNTYFMAISAKGEDHSEIEGIYVKQMNILATEGKYFYHGGLRRIIKVKAGLLSDCVDRPERTSMLRIGDHNGTFSSFWGFACLVDGECKHNYLPDCNACRRVELEKQLQGTNDASPSDVPPSELGKDNMLAIFSRVCPHRKCSSWNVLDQSFHCPAPKSYPETCDTRDGAPEPPIGREVVSSTEETPTDPIPAVVGQSGNKRRRVTALSAGNPLQLPAIQLTTDWLTKAVCFAHHNMKTHPPNTPRNKRYWKKSMLSAYLRSCGVNNRLVDEIYDSAKKGEGTPPTPSTWIPKDAVERQHYGAMHLLGLGHIKSNFEMISKMMGHFEIKATFGAQANVYLKEVQSQHCTRFFPAHPLSTSSWGTGAWVSENYFFFARAIKFFFLLPAFRQDRVALKYPSYKEDISIVLRFVDATQAAFSRLMSKKRVEPDMHRVVTIYLDTMVELDRWLFNLPEDISDEATDQQDQTTSNPTSQAATMPAGTNRRSRKQPNFLKSNSLGMIDATRAHLHFGPAIANFEGGWTGEKKVQPIRPFMSLKRSNADWETISLRRIQQHESIQWLLASLSDSNAKRKSREMEGVVRYFKNRDQLEQHLSKSRPVVGVVDGDNTIWIAFRPQQKDYPEESSQRKITRSSLDIVAVDFDDSAGELVGGMCWMSPIKLTNRVRQFDDAFAFRDALISQYVLMLPMMADDAKSFKNFYYCIGHLWTERKSTGLFARSNIDPGPFASWLQTDIRSNVL